VRQFHRRIKDIEEAHGATQNTLSGKPAHAKIWRSMNDVAEEGRAIDRRLRRRLDALEQNCKPVPPPEPESLKPQYDVRAGQSAHGAKTWEIVDVRNGCPVEVHYPRWTTLVQTEGDNVTRARAEARCAEMNGDKEEISVEVSPCPKCGQPIDMLTAPAADPREGVVFLAPCGCSVTRETWRRIRNTKG
jgi:hypothetical protein